MELVKVEHIVKHFRKQKGLFGSFETVRAADDVSLSIQEGETLGLVGESGCGKSTLLRIIAGLERNFRGTLTLDGRQVRGRHPEIGFIFQEPRLLPWLTVAENVGFGAGAAGGNGLGRA